MPNDGTGASLDQYGNYLIGDIYSLQEGEMRPVRPAG
jgi:hypothetical protein